MASVEGEGAENWASAFIGVLGWGGEERTRVEETGGVTHMVIYVAPRFSRKENLRVRQAWGLTLKLVYS